MTQHRLQPGIHFEEGATAPPAYRLLLLNATPGADRAAVSAALDEVIQMLEELAKASPVAAWTRKELGAAATHSAADTSSEQMTRAAGAARAAEAAPPDAESGGGGARSSQSSPACSGAGGVTSTTCRPRASAAFASSSVTRSSFVKGRRYAEDASFW